MHFCHLGYVNWLEYAQIFMEVAIEDLQYTFESRELVQMQFK